MTISPRPLTFSRNQEGAAMIGGLVISDLIEAYGSPLYILDQETITANCEAYTTGLSKNYPNFKLMYAGKANLTIGLLNLLASNGMGVDVVSGGELYTALQSQMNPDLIIFHGNNKSIQELELAISHDVTVVLDNMQELERIQKIATSSKKAKVMVRLKPEIEAHTHKYIKTGQSDSKFGVTASEMMTMIKECHESDSVHFLGIHSHIGSQIFDSAPYVELVDCMLDHVLTIKNELGIEIEQLNLGGGIGISYTDQDQPLAIPNLLTDLSQRLVQKLDQHQIKHPVLLLEPGRSIIGNAGITVYTIGTIKQVTADKTYIFVDGGMADNPRPMMYQSEYTIELSRLQARNAVQTYTIAGKFCESGDILATDIQLPSPKVDDLLIVHGTGAYNYSMASNYNRACRPAMIMVNQGQPQIVVQRESFDDLIRLDSRLEFE